MDRDLLQNSLAVAERRDTGRAIQLLRKFEELLAKRNAERDRLRKELGL